ncbi:hypothetical protein F2P79_004040 [Pimephales promelas]|nr:hypothetical protein F2P79_004040 [Pimephales promelas]
MWLKRVTCSAAPVKNIFQQLQPVRDTETAGRQQRLILANQKGIFTARSTHFKEKRKTYLGIIWTKANSCTTSAVVKTSA